MVKCQKTQESDMRTVLFDLDGTLLDTLRDLTDAINYTLRQFSLPARTEEEVRSFVGNGIRAALSLALPEGEKEKIEEALPVFQEYYRLHSNCHTKPFAGVKTLLSRLQEEGYEMAVVSNKKEEYTRALVREHFPQIRVAVGETEGLQRKPAPDLVFLALHLLGAKKEDCIYVGDTQVDVKTAENAALRFLGVSWGFRSRGELIRAGAKNISSTPEELYETIREAFS